MSTVKDAIRIAQTALDKVTKLEQMLNRASAAVAEDKAKAKAAEAPAPEPVTKKKVKTKTSDPK